MRDLTIPAIPTLYAGVLFRSRTEARWARFWDALDIRWEYEPQGFVAAGIPYLPDFAVFPALGLLWVEVKPTWQADPEGVGKWRGFAMRRPGRPERSRAALFAGPPSLEGEYLIIGGDDDQPHPLKGPWEDDTQQWRPCPSGHHFDLTYPGTFGAKYVEDGCGWHIGPGDDRLRTAVEKARSAKFDGTDSGTVA